MPVVFKTEKPVKKSSFLAAFINKPASFHFETQKSKEEIVLLLRRHPITNLGWILVVILMMLAPLVVLSFLPAGVIPARFIFIGLVNWGLFIFGFSFERFLSWYFNVNILTDERVIDIGFPSLLYRDISEAKLQNVQDISIKAGGYLRSLFNFGDVEIQTAGAIPEICFEAIPNPERVVKILNKLIEEEEEEN